MGQGPTNVIVVTGGDPLHPADAACLPAGAYVVAADSGVEQAAALGLRVDLAVGDFDSVSDAALDAAVASGAEVERHPAAKDHTDLELGLMVARRLDARRVTVLGGHGGRLDHLLANALLLANASLEGMVVDARMGGARVLVVRGGETVRLAGRPGELVSLLAVGGPATGLRTEGLLYALDDDELQPGSTRGVSNELVHGAGSVGVGQGTLLVVLPGQLGTHVLEEVAQ